MTHQALLISIATALASLSAVSSAYELTAANTFDSNTTQIKVNCDSHPKALKNALERKVSSREKTRLVISGECHGPLSIEQGNLEIVNDARRSGSLLVTQANAEQAAILVQSASVRLEGFDINVPTGMAAIKAQANASVDIDGMSTNAKSDWEVPRGQYIATDSSSLFLSRLTEAEVLVIGASSANFGAENRQITLDVRDTSAAKSSGEANTFKQVQASANAYFLADNKARIAALGIWGKAAVEINRESEVGKIDMGGQTLFAAYRKSSVTGPYGLYGNVVFELEHSTASNWVTPSKPYAIFSGNNATVNSVLYPGWSWSGQGSKP
ncbi:hypothetical protein ABHF33_15570 [Chitinibacter sp. FCG-7]|uniref:Auto-transporter adhesin head GIN domain-containing protein n=1 Tax=Chitinibacter mangrovi TaxID=3153927 RepID=A0AAU7F9S4_9NEIS